MIKFFALLIALSSGWIFAPFLSYANEATRENSASPVFLSVIPDFPLAPGMEEISERGAVFDKPGGRIAESYIAQGPNPRDQILDFYQKILPQFGWQPLSRTHYIREGEQIRLRFEAAEDTMIMSVTLTPRAL